MKWGRIVGEFFDVVYESVESFHMECYLWDISIVECIWVMYVDFILNGWVKRGWYIWSDPYDFSDMSGFWM